MECRGLIIALAALPTIAFAAEPIPCALEGLSVAAETPLAAKICTIAEAEIAALGQCNLPVPMPLAIRVTTDLEGNCLGLFHCGEGIIDIRPPDDLKDLILPENPLAAISTEGLFASLIRHELVHAAYDGAPCPFSNCAATAEYLAYGMQVMGLPDEDLAKYESLIENPKIISRDEINLVYMMLSPHRFAQKAYQHLSQRPDPCEYVGWIMDGDIVFDFEPF